MSMLHLLEDGDGDLHCLKVKGDNNFVEAVTELLSEFSNVFKEPKSLPPLREGHNHLIIPQTKADPVNLRPYRYPAVQKNAIEDMEKDLLQSQVIQESSSPFASPILLVKKKDRSWRMCNDYRELNKRTVKNKYPIPLVEELLVKLKDARSFTKLDLQAGYHQIRMEPKDIYKTAFRTHLSHYK